MGRRAIQLIEEVLRGRSPRRVVEQEVTLGNFVVDQEGDSLTAPWAKGDRVSWTGRPDAKPGTVEMVEGERVTVKWDDGTMSEVLWGELVAIEKTEGMARLRRLGRKREAFQPGDRVALSDDSELDPGAKGTVKSVFDGGAEVRFDEPTTLGTIAVQNGEIHKIKEGRKREQDGLELKKRLADRYGTDVETVNDVLRKLQRSSETDARDLAKELGLTEDEAEELVEDLKNSFDVESRSRKQEARFAGEFGKVEDQQIIEELLTEFDGRVVATTGGPNFDPRLVSLVVDFRDENVARDFLGDLLNELQIKPEEVSAGRVWFPVETSLGDRLRDFG